MMNKKKKKAYTVMFIPDDNGRTFYIRINRSIIYALVFFCVIFVLGIVALLLGSGEIGAKLQLTYSLLNENKRLKDENAKLRDINSKIESIEHTRAYLRRLAASIGEGTIGTPVSKLASGKEKIYTEDSLDAFIGDLRTDETEVYKEARRLTASRGEGVSYSIPNISPVDGWITKKFRRESNTSFNNHLGLDFAAKRGTPIRSTAPGIIHSVSNDTYLGLIITVKHSLGFITRYGHCMQALVSRGDRVERGQTIGLLGNTGRSSAPHVHYEIIKNGKHEDPLKYIFKRM